MAVALRKKKRVRPKLNKKFVSTHEGWDVYTVDASALRSIAKPDEEFGNFAGQDQFPDLIPPGQIWIGEKNQDKEGVFFIANAGCRSGRFGSKRTWTAGNSPLLSATNTLNFA